LTALSIPVSDNADKVCHAFLVLVYIGTLKLISSMVL
jgi:hypothetical protein